MHISIIWYLNKAWGFLGNTIHRHEIIWVRLFVCPQKHMTAASGKNTQSLSEYPL
jgi:hypothetical protein